MTTLTIGNSQRFSTIAAAVAAAKPGDTLQIQAGTYTNDFPGYINGLTITGVGGQVNLVATRPPPNGKAYLDEGGNTTISGLSISGVTDSDGNGAAVRYEGGNLTLSGDTITSNQDGLLGNADPNGTISITGSTFSGNGTSAGNAHDIYVGNISKLTITGSSITNANTGHEIKSRAQNTVITGDTISGSNDSYEIDLPNGGNATIDNDKITKGANSNNSSMIAYGEEGGANTLSGTQNSGTNLDLSNDTFDASAYTAHHVQLVLNAGGANVTGSGDTLTGIPTSQLGSGVPVTITATGGSTTPTTNTTNVVVGLAEEAYQGDAQASVAIDGTTLGQPTVKVLQNSGQYQAYGYQDQLAAGSHTWTVSFLNDAWGGSASTDRNLYVDHVNINGASYPAGLPAALYSTGDTLTIPFRTS